MVPCGGPYVTLPRSGVCPFCPGPLVPAMWPGTWEKPGCGHSSIGRVARELAPVSPNGSPLVVVQGPPSSPVTQAIELGVTCAIEGLALLTMKLRTA